MSEVIVSDLVAACVEAALLACQLIRAIQASGNLDPVEKGNGKDFITGRPMADIQTEADRQSESVIFSTLLRYYPGLAIVGEEEASGLEVTDAGLASPRATRSVFRSDIERVVYNLTSEDSVVLSDLAVFVDPLDGTNEFVNNRLHCVSVLIGVACRGIPLAGVIARPFPDADCPNTLLYGVVGTGAFLDHNRITQPPCSVIPYKVTTTLKKANRITNRFFDLVPSEIVREGGAGWKCWLVIVGKADCYQYARPGTKKWDILAGDAIVTALGGMVTDACGRKLVYSLDPATFGNDWGVMVSMHKRVHFSTFVPASHRALVEASADANFNQWPSGLTVPALHTDLDASL